MNRTPIPLLCATLVVALAANAQDRHGGDDQRGGQGGGGGGGGDHQQRPQQPTSRPQAPSRPAPQRAPVVIYMGRPNRATAQPAAQPQGGQVHSPQVRSQRPVQPAPYHPATYGRIQWDLSPGSPEPSRPARPPERESHVAEPNYHAAHAIAHHPYTQGYVRKRLQTLGVKSEPGYITDRSEMVLTSRAHTKVPHPDRGLDNGVLHANPVSARHFNNGFVKNQMGVVGRPEYLARLEHANAEESERGHYYWHRDDGFNYGHYVDDYGFNWYGWYVGDQYFWTRDYEGRWWWYDDDVGRWCFWNDNFWWWQDPNHIGDLYCYNDGTYIPANSSEDPVEVASTEAPSLESFASPDSSRLVRISGDTKDAFLYDGSSPATFQPVYLASGVESVEFSDPHNGNPLQIILKLDDGGFDVLDAQGNPYVSDETRRSIAE
jgi:hypothetical protein